MNAKISVFVICVEAIVYFLLDILYDSTFNKATLLPPHWSFTQTSQCRNWKANKYSILTVSELGPPVLESSTRISKFYASPTDSEQNGSRKSITHRIQTAIVLIGNPKS